MITGNHAVLMLSELISAEVEVVKQANSPRGLTKKAVKRESTAISNVFEALVGRTPSEAEIKEIAQG